MALPDELLGERLRVPFPTGDAPCAGAARAPVEVMYINDYDCWAVARASRCRRPAERLRQAPADRGPPGAERRDQNNPNGPLVAEAAWAAHAQGKFWEMHDKLFSLEIERNRATLERYAARSASTSTTSATALDDGRYRKKVAEDVELLERAGLRERPLFVVNGRRADGRDRAGAAGGGGAARRPGSSRRPARVQGPARRGAPRGPMILGLTTPQRFHLEPRDEAWAASVEKPLAQMAERDLRAIDPGMAAVQVECRSDLCRLRFRPGKERHAAVAFLRQVYRADLPVPAVGGETLAYLHVRDARQAVSGDDSVAALRSARTTRLYSLRTGRLPPDPDLPLERLPRE